MKLVQPISDTLGIFTQTFRYLHKSKNQEHRLPELKIAWAREMLERLSVEIEIRGKADHGKSLLLVGNHISYLDIPLLMAAAPNLSFVAKQEINSWPVFGSAARRIDTVFVHRESKGSRKSARESVVEALRSGRRVVIFPSGTTCVNESKAWRRGAFEIAQAAGVRLQPFRISYTPLRAAAYIDQDFFPFHLYNLFQTEPIWAVIEFHDSVPLLDPAADCQRWQSWSRGLIHANGH
jgi:lyso-ornithine lipid O-acyltransferase